MSLHPAGPDDEFLWLGNHPATDLCNTVPVIDGVVVDLLPDHDAILRWAAAIGVPAMEVSSEREQRQTIRFVHQLRATVRDALVSPVTAPPSLTAINEVLAGERGTLVVTSFGDSQGDNVSFTSTAEPSRFRLALATAVIDIFNYAPMLIRECARPECVLLFLDTSKSGRRRWCDMTTCGNRSKAAAHYARTRDR